MMILRRKREAGEEPTEPKLVERLQDMYLVIMITMIIINDDHQDNNHYVPYHNHDVPFDNHIYVNRCENDFVCCYLELWR